MEEFLFESSDTKSMTEELIREYSNKRVIILNSEIDGYILENVSLYILKWNKEDKHVPVAERKPIWLYLQSLGGGVIDGFNLIDIIQSSKTPIYTLCFSECASMAFHIFIAGHKKYAFKNSVLLIHDGQISINNSTSKAKDTMKFIEELDSRIKKHVISNTAITSDFYDSIYDSEYFIYANTEGKELKCVDAIIGEEAELSDIL